MKTVLARDALDLVKLAPTSALLWQRLGEFLALLGPAERSFMIDEIAGVTAPSKDVAWLQYSALAFITRDVSWLHRQAALADETTSTDAIMTLFVVSWHHALARAGDRADFVRTFEAIEPVRLQRLVAARLSGPRPPARAPRKPLRVAVYTSQVSSNRHGGTAFTLNMMSVLASQGMEVTAFTAQETTIPGAQGYCGGNEWPKPQPVSHESVVAPVPSRAKLALPNCDFSMRRRFEQNFHAIHAYDPDLVLFVGFVSPLIFALYEHYPVVGLSVHTLPPVVPLDMWLCQQVEEGPHVWSPLRPPRRVDFPFRFWPGNSPNPIDKALTGAADDSVVLATVGYRLESEIASPWREQMLAFLDRHPRAHWLLIGASAQGAADHLPRHPRIRAVPPQTNLDGWLVQCDVYVNPPRMGGGASIARAMELGIPVASFAGSDGGDKAGPWAAASTDAYFEQLGAWVADAGARRRAGESLKERFRHRLDMSSDRAGRALSQACREAIESFNCRRKPSHD